MSIKIDKEIIEESKKEIKKMLQDKTPEDIRFEEIKDDEEHKSNISNNSEKPVEEKSDKEKELEEKFQKFADKFDGKIGRSVTEFVDDFKTNLLWLYALKNKINIPKEALKMPEDGKDLCSTLIDYAISDKILEYIKKYPILAAGALVAINAGSSYLVIEALKSNKQEAKNTSRENKENPSKQTVEDTINNLI
ncbi:MAG: hypothetical protein N2558_04890 [Patescibacteria group bacterium]|nr:hypothetical protein [Patescibacteria group bacterium]